MKIARTFILVVATMVVATANTFTFSTPAGSSVVDGPVSAQAVFVTSPGQVVITLTDLQPNPTSAGQLVSDLEFQFIAQLSGAVVFSSSSSQEVSVVNHVATLGSTVDTGWGFGLNGPSFILCIICNAGVTPPYHTAPPSHLIIGPGPYTNENASVENHEPSLNGSATFTLTNPDISVDTIIGNVTFSFGTTFGSDVQTTTLVPEPVTMIMTGLALLALSQLRRRTPK